MSQLLDVGRRNSRVRNLVEPHPYRPLTQYPAARFGIALGDRVLFTAIDFPHVRSWCPSQRDVDGFDAPQDSLVGVILTVRGTVTGLRLQSATHGDMGHRRQWR